MKQRKYSRKELLASGKFSDYQKDFLAAVLMRPEYTLEEAEKAVRDFFKKE